jgi:hypothetical protein
MTVLSTAGLIALLCLGGWGLAGCREAAAWSARKTPPPPRSSPARSAPKKPAAIATGAAPAPLGDRVAAAVTAQPVRAAVLLVLLQEASRVRETALQTRLAAALETCREVSTAQWMAAAQWLGSDHPASRRLWQRA